MRFILLLVKGFFFSSSKSSSLLVSGVSFLGVGLGVFTMIIVLGVMQGFDTELKKRILDVQGHVAVFKFQSDVIENPDEVKAKIEGVKGVILASPFITQEILIIKDKEVSGTLIRGVDPSQEKSILNLKPSSIKGVFSFDKSNIREIVLGKSLAENLGAGLGDYVTLASPSLSKNTPLGSTGPRLLRCKVIGIIDLGLYQFNNNISYISLETARYFFKIKENSVSGFSVKLSDPYKANDMRLVISRLFGGFPYLTSSWQELNSNLFEAVALERLVMFVILVIILIVSSFSIVSSLVIMVLERMKTIGILGSMGVSKRRIQLIFLSIGLLIGVSGTLAGIGAGLLSGHLLSKYDVLHLPVDVYWVQGTPFYFPMEHILILVLFSIIISLAFYLALALKRVVLLQRVDSPEALKLG